MDEKKEFLGSSNASFADSKRFDNFLDSSKTAVFADLHIHSRFSRATSKDLTLENLEKYARIKGINLLGTGDFTHPKWLDELKEHLAEDKTGILKTKTGFPFVLQTEVSNIFSQDNRQ